MGYALRAETQFSAGHRLIGYSGRCSSPHGHTYRVELVLSGSELDHVGMVMDFGSVKDELRSWIDQHWDHAFLLNSLDVRMIRALQSVEESRLFLFDQSNPTAENMARTLYRAMHKGIGHGVTAAIVWETSQQYAQYSENS
jgi:6-pyruvoyltetrahydropterin/6-carboxytetrahydropterin synthase